MAFNHDINLRLRPFNNVLGIDLGTDNTVVAVWTPGKSHPEITPIENNDRIIPSYVWCKNDGTFDVGKNAVKNLKNYPLDVCYDAKRMIGQNYADLNTLDTYYWSFKIVNNNGRPAYELSDKRLISPEEITTQILKNAKSLAEKYFGITLKYAVITVPTFFVETQKQATLEVAKRAGLTVLSLETEPTAVAFAFNYDQKRYDDYNLFIFDLGGGSFDITILSIKDERFIIEATGGDSSYSGRDFDDVLMKELTKRLKQHGAQNLHSVKLNIMLRELAKLTKIALTTCDKEIVNLSALVENDNETMYEIITRADFENFLTHLKSVIRDSCLKALIESNMNAEDFHRVLLIGGLSKMPMVNMLLSDIFPQYIDESSFYQSKGINPNEIVAYGAVVRAAQLSSPRHRDYKVPQNILSIAIGIGLIENQYSLMIRSRTNFPIKLKKRYFTTENDQKSASIVVYEGERIQPRMNREILSFEIVNLRNGPAGDVYVDVIFEIDENAILKVTAKSQSSIVKRTIDYRAMRSAGKPIEQLFKELAINAESDQQKKILMEARSELRNNVEDIKKRYQNEKNVPYNKKQNILDDCDEVIDWLDEHPDETLDEDTINTAKQIEKKAKELIDLRLMYL